MSDAWSDDPEKGLTCKIKTALLSRVPYFPDELVETKMELK